jgi:hypothetical protein
MAGKKGGGVMSRPSSKKNKPLDYKPKDKKTGGY